MMTRPPGVSSRQSWLACLDRIGISWMGGIGGWPRLWNRYLRSAEADYSVSDLRNQNVWCRSRQTQLGRQTRFTPPLKRRIWFSIFNALCATRCTSHTLLAAIRKQQLYDRTQERFFQPKTEKRANLDRGRLIRLYDVPDLVFDIDPSLVIT